MNLSSGKILIWTFIDLPMAMSYTRCQVFDSRHEPFNIFQFLSELSLYLSLWSWSQLNQTVQLFRTSNFQSWTMQSLIVPSLILNSPLLWLEKLQCPTKNAMLVGKWPKKEEFTTVALPAILAVHSSDDTRWQKRKEFAGVMADARLVGYIQTFQINNIIISR